MYPQAVFEFLGRGVYLYGICIALGLISCLAMFYYLTKKAKMPEKMQDYIFFVLIAGLAAGFFFAALFQAFYDWLNGKPFEIGAGLTFMGGLVGGVSGFLIVYFLVAKFYFKGKEKNLHLKHFNTLARVAPICICIAHGFGRIGCLMAGCCHGEFLGQEYVFGGIWMKSPTMGWGYFVPTQLYEALFLFLLAAIMTVLFFKRFNPMFVIYLIGYGVWRIVIEFFRGDYRGGVEGAILSPSQWFSIIFIVGGIALIVIYKLTKLPIFLPQEANEEPQVQQEQDQGVEKQ